MTSMSRDVLVGLPGIRLFVRMAVKNGLIISFLLWARITSG